jgi:hypothetical protein
MRGSAHTGRRNGWILQLRPQAEEEDTMLFNVATGSLILSLFVGTCAIGVSKSLARITRPVAFGALALALVLYAAGYFS